MEVIVGAISLAAVACVWLVVRWRGQLLGVAWPPLAGRPASAFEPVSLTWRGRKYQIPPDQVLAAIAKVEDVITLGEIADYLERGTLPFAKVARAWGQALRHAGAQVSDEDIYAEMFGEKATDAQNTAAAGALALQAMMVPPPHLRKKEGKA